MLHPFSQIQLRCPLQSLRTAYDITLQGNTMFQEGLYLSSPEFWAEFQRKTELNEKDGKKLEIGYAKYWLRSSARPTPYGTFAGSAMVNITDAPSLLTLAQHSSHKRSLRLDMNYLAEMVQALVDLPGIRRQLRFFPNNSIYPTPDGYRYAAYTIADNVRHYQLTSFGQTSYIDALLARASTGATFEDLSQLLLGDETVTKEDAIAFLLDLHRSQILIAELEPAVTGTDPFEAFITRLETLKTPTGLLEQLKEVQALLHRPGTGTQFYLSIEEKLKDLGLPIAIPKNTVQADLFLALQTAQINKELVSTIIQQADELSVLSKQAINSDLLEFKRKFHARYEDAEIPLAIALDADLGIGYAGVSDDSGGSSDLIDGLQIVGREAKPNSAFDEIQALALTKYNAWLKFKKDTITIEAEDLKTFKKPGQNPNFPTSMHLMGSLFKRNGLLDATHFAFDLTGLTGPSGANLLGRFAHGDETICQHVREVLSAEEQADPDAIYAEIAHLPQTRLGNILLRPVLRKFEIPYVGLSGADKEHQLMLPDLVVSVRNGEVMLRSKKYGKRVMPRLTTAHNFTGINLPIYKFLCDLQGQRLVYPVLWDWGQLASLKHLPRVSYKDLIIQKAVWTVEEKDLAGLPECAEFYPAWLAEFRAEFNLPERVVYKEGDNELLIDFTQKTGIELFLHYLKRHKTIKLQEFLFTEDNCVVSDPDGAPYTNELVIPVYRDTQPANASAVSQMVPAKTSSSKTVQRVFLPQSEWTYFKIYGGAKTIESLLTHTLLPFIENGIAKRLFERFFFIRYLDENGNHLRVRFFNTDKDRQLPVYTALMALLGPLVANGSIHKVMLDCYQRELERYSPALIDTTETLFYHDSLAVIRFINLLTGIDGDKYRFLFAMRGIDALLADFGLSPKQKAELMLERQAAFFQECGGQPALQKQLNERYRKDQRFIADHMDENKDSQNEIEEAADIFRIRSSMNAPVICNMLSGWPDPHRTEHMNVLLASYLHMFVNRLFVAQQRKYELVVYHFLQKYYSSSIAIHKKESADAIPVL